MVAYIRKMAVEKKRWLDDQSAHDGVALCQTIPGATAMQMSAYVGLRAKGVTGAAASFIGFGLPAFLFMMILSAFYARTHTLPAVVSAFNGLQAVVVALVANATLSFGRTSIKNWKNVINALIAAGLFGLKINPILVIIVAAFLGVVLYAKQPHPSVVNPKDKAHAPKSLLLILLVTAIGFTGFLPGEDDPARVKNLIGTAAKLEITDVKDGPFATRDAALAQHGGVLPLNTKLVQMLPRAGTEGDQWYLVGKSPVISGREMRNARAGQDEFRKWETNFSLSQDAGRRFGRYTEANIGNKLAVVLDDKIVSVATIQSKIEDSGRIMGLSSEEEAVDLSRFLRSGSLPASVKYLEERSIGPSLGADSIREGLRAGVAGLLAVIIVMLFYYKRSGVNAVLALLLNTVVLLAAISYFKAVLTLPGIAGVILTIGMAVDSNVLIFERIREELRAGKGVLAAVDTGFNKAWWTIVDTHVTTVVSCAFLFLFGEGPVKGFAVTLVIGLISNVFTAVFVSRTIFEYELSGRRQMQELSI